MTFKLTNCVVSSTENLYPVDGQSLLVAPGQDPAAPLPSFLSLFRRFKIELLRNEYITPDGRITEKLQTEIPPLHPDQVQQINTLLDREVSACSRKGDLIPLKLRNLLHHLHLQMKGPVRFQWVGGGVRNLLYSCPEYSLDLLRKLEIPDAESYLPLLANCAQRRLPDTDIRLWLGQEDVADMNCWWAQVSTFLGQKAENILSKKNYFCGEDADYTVATVPVRLDEKQRHELEFLFIHRFKREVLFCHELVVDIEHLKLDGDPRKFWQAIVDLHTRTLHVNNPEEVNFDGLPTLISYYVRGWTLGDDAVEPLFLEKFFDKAFSNGGAVKHFEFLYKKTWKNHHHSDPEAAIALAFNFCTAAKGMPRVKDAMLLEILRSVRSWFKKGDYPKDHLLWRILDQKDCTLEELIQLVYTQGIVDQAAFPNACVAMDDHRNGEAFQLKLKGKHEPLHLLIPKEYCQLNPIGVVMPREFAVESPLAKGLEEFSLDGQQFWGQGESLLMQRKDANQVDAGYRWMMLGQYVEPNPEKVPLLLRHLPLAMAVQPDHASRENILSCLGPSGICPALLARGEELLKEEFKAREYLFSWMGVLAASEEESLRFHAWELWKPIAPSLKKSKVKRERALFEAYLPHDIDRALTLFLTMGPSLNSMDRWRAWKKLCAAINAHPQKAKLATRIEDIASVVEGLGMIPFDAKNDHQLFTANAAFFSFLMNNVKPSALLPVMCQALSYDLLKRSCPDVEPIWIQFCYNLLEVSPEDADQAFMLGKRRSLYQTTAAEMFDFQLQLAESFQRLRTPEGRQRAAELRESIRREQKLQGEVKERILAMEVEDFYHRLGNVQGRDPREVKLLLNEWRILSDQGCQTLNDATHQLMTYYKKEDLNVLASMICHRVTARALREDPIFLESVFSLVQQSLQLKCGLDTFKLFFVLYESFDEEQREEGLLAVYHYLKERWDQRSTLPGVIKNALITHASQLIKFSNEPITCFYFLNQFERTVKLTEEGWSLLVQQAEGEENFGELFKLTCEMKSSGCPVSLLYLLVQRVVSDPATAGIQEIIDRIEEFSSWDEIDGHETLSQPLLNCIKASKVDTWIAKKELLQQVIPEKMLKPYLQKQIDSCEKNAIKEAIELGKTFGFFQASNLLSIAEGALFSNIHSLKAAARDFCSLALQGFLFLEGDLQTQARCWDAYFCLCEAMGDQGMVRFVHEALVPDSPFAQALDACDPPLRREILFRLIESAIKQFGPEEEYLASIDCIEQALATLDLPPADIENLVSTYLECATPKVFMCALKHLKKIKRVAEPKIYQDVFRVFEYLANIEFGEREEMESLVQEVYFKLGTDDRYIDQILFPAEMLLCFAQARTDGLRQLGLGLVSRLLKDPDHSPEVRDTVKLFIISILRCKNDEWIRPAEEMIRTDALNNILEKDQVTELWYQMIHIKLNDALESNHLMIEGHPALQDFLENFGRVFCSKYNIDLSRDYMQLLCKMNALSLDHSAFSQYMLYYAHCLNNLHPNKPIEIHLSPKGTFTVMFNGQLMDIVEYPEESKALLTCYHPAIHCFALESTAAKFNSVENRMKTVGFIFNWFKSFIHVTRNSTDVQEDLIKTCLMASLVFWVNDLTPAQIYQHMGLVYPMLLEALQKNIFAHKGDFLLQVTFAISPFNQITLESMKGFPPECVIKNFTEAILKLTRSCDPSAFAWAMLMMHQNQRFVFKEAPKTYARLMDLVLRDFIKTAVANPDWKGSLPPGVEIKYFDGGMHPLQTWLASVVKMRWDELGTAHGPMDIDKMFNPLVKAMLKAQFVLCDSLSAFEDKHPMLSHCVFISEILIDPVVWSCYFKNLQEYWTHVDQLIQQASSLFDDHELELKHASGLSGMLLSFFGSVQVGKLSVNAVPFQGINFLEQDVLRSRIGSFYRLAKVLLKHFRARPNGEPVVQDLKQHIERYLDCRFLFPATMSSKKEKFRRLL